MKGVKGLRRLIIDGDRYQSVASIRRKLLKKTHTEERRVHILPLISTFLLGNINSCYKNYFLIEEYI